MGNNLGYIRSFSEHEHSANGNVWGNIKFNYFHYIITVFKEDFQRHRMTTWWLGHILGLGGVLFSFLDMLSIKDIVEGMPSGFRYCITFFSLVYVLFQSLRAYERWQSDRKDNALKQMDIEHKKMDLIERQKKQNGK